MLAALGIYSAGGGRLPGVHRRILLFLNCSEVIL